ncbi:MAG TPA: ComEC/Rec2 family competence protein [Saprospiraceae bacterium]|nr:ComEC/Rec2 family competence protein [Saprospiraceae bacterium]
MPTIRTTPGLRILSCILAGFFLASLMPPDWLRWYSLLGSVLIFAPILLYRKKGYHYPLFALSAAVVLMLLSSCIYLRYQKKLTNRELLLSKTVIEQVVLLEESERSNSWRYRARILTEPLKNIEIYIYSREAMPYTVGTVLTLNQTAEIFEKPKNPDQFDYRSFCMRKGIFGRLFLHPEDVNQMGRVSGWRYASVLWRKKLLDKLEEFLTGQELHLAQALLLGFRDEMPAELRDKFRESGNMHLLAISGMHMGIIAWVLHLLFQRLFPYRKQKKWAHLGTLISLWVFLAICSFPASGIRACCMISLFMTGQLYMKGQNTFNLLLCTAAIMLLIQPGYVHDLGFQLSCAAVLSILVFYPRIYSLLQFKNKIIDSSVSIAALGISAQIGTLGLSMHYFHVFSPWFWLTGIPGAFLATINMILGVIFLSTTVIIPALGHFLGNFLAIALSALIKCMDWSYYLSWHHLEGIFWPGSMVWSYYFFLISTAFFIYLRNYKSLRTALVCLVVFFISFRAHRINVARQFEICKVIGLGYPVYEISHGHQTVIWNPAKVPREKIDFFMHEHRIRNGIEQVMELKTGNIENLSGLIKASSQNNEADLIDYIYLEGKIQEKRQWPRSNENIDYFTLNTNQNEKLKELEKMDLP